MCHVSLFLIQKAHHIISLFSPGLPHPPPPRSLPSKFPPQAGDKKFDIVFISSDKDEAAFNAYFGGEHPWLALPFGDRARKAELSKKFKVRWKGDGAS